MNPWFILIAVLALAGAGAGGYRAGHVNGDHARAVADQGQIDKMHGDIEKMKSVAAKIVNDAEQHAIDDQKHDADVKKEQDRVALENTAKTDALERKYSGRGLQYRPVDSGRGDRGASGVPVASAASGAETGPVVQLPNALARSLRLDALDADQLADEYRKCLAYEDEMTAWRKAHP